MPIRINEVNSTVHAFDATALLTEEVLSVLIDRLTEEVERRQREGESRRQDTQVDQGRRAVD